MGEWALLRMLIKQVAYLMKSSSIFSRGRAIWLAGFGTLAALGGLAGTDSRWIGQLPEAVLLALGAAVAARVARSAGNVRPLRLTLTFLLPAFLLLPPAPAVLVALAACLGSGGSAPGGPLGAGRNGYARTAIGFAPLLLLPDSTLRVDPADPATLALLVLGYALLQTLLALGAAITLRSPERGFALFRLRRRPRLILEGINIPLAWLLAALLSSGSHALAVAMGLLVVGAAWSLVRLTCALADLASTRSVLSRRAAELETLHAIGCEILATPEPGRVFRVIDRECRRILPADAFFIALADSRSHGLKCVYRRRDETPGRLENRPLQRGLATHAVAQKRGVRICDFHRLPVDSPLRREIVGDDMRSTLTVPLLVDNRVIGVMSVQSTAVSAYDRHQLALLATIAQQVAVAVESARHYELATFDSLTRFYTRDYFFKRLEDEYARAKRYETPFALLMLDLDGFKQINDEHGHLAGDGYLRAVGDVVRQALREADSACRYGGDEFCILLPETDLLGGRVIAERIRRAIADLSVAPDGESVRTTVSIGIVAYPAHDVGDLESLLRNADAALYRAKHRGRDCVVPYAA
jgi:diguanylate cyclase (GGDEF)-like protein